MSKLPSDKSKPNPFSAPLAPGKALPTPPGQSPGRTCLLVGLVLAVGPAAFITFFGTCTVFLIFDSGGNDAMFPLAFIVAGLAAVLILVIFIFLIVKLARGPQKANQQATPARKADAGEDELPEARIPEDPS